MVWIIIEEDRIDGITTVVSVWDNYEAARQEFDRLRAQDNYGISYALDEWEVRS